MDENDLIDEYYDNEKELFEILTVRDSIIPNANKGLFTTASITKGTIIGEYFGKRYSEDKIFSNDTSKYVFAYEKNKVKFRINPSLDCILRYVNDIFNFDKSVKYGELYNYDTITISGVTIKISYNVDWFLYDEKVYMITIRDINEGEELFINYDCPYWKFCIQKPFLKKRKYKNDVGDIIFNRIIKRRQEEYKCEDISNENKI
jgi:hypothetical protein